MANEPFFASENPDVVAQQLEYQRKKNLSNLLSNQAMDIPQGQMVSGHYIAPSWGQQVARVLQGYYGGKMGTEADQGQKDFASEMNKRLIEGLKQYRSASEGIPGTKDQEVQSNALINPDGSQKNITIPGKPAIPSNPRLAAESLLTSNHPLLQQAGMQQLLNPAIEKFGNEPRYDQNGRAYLVGERGTVKYLDNISARDKVEIGPGGQAYNPYKLQPGQVLNDPNKPFGMNEQGIQPNTAYQNYELNKAGAGATRVNIPINTEKTYAGNIAEGLAKQDVATIEAARTAGERIRNAQSIKQLLDKNPITGTGAESRLMLNKALATAGIIDGSRVANTEQLASLLASSTLDAIKTSGLGSGQGFTDKDRQFLERARSGNLEINAKTLRDLADLNERVARSHIEQGRKVASRLKSTTMMGDIGQDLQFDEPSQSRNDVQSNVQQNRTKSGVTWSIAK